MKTNEQGKRNIRQMRQSTLLLAAVRSYFRLAYTAWLYASEQALHSSLDVLVLLIQYS